MWGRMPPLAPMFIRPLDTLVELVEGGGVLDSFTIRCNLCPKNLCSVDSWVYFALEKMRVKRLVFYPTTLFACCRTAYNFPPLEYFYSQQPNLQSLTSISFWRLKVSREVIEHLLSNCPLLQSLELRELGLSHLRVSCEARALTHMTIIDCICLTTSEITAPRLLSFNYANFYAKDTNSINVKFCELNVPKVEEFEIGVVQIPLADRRHLFSYFACIQKLKLHILTKEPDNSFKVMKLTSVKHLTMAITADICEYILAWTPLLKAFPILNKFTLEMYSRSAGRIKKASIDDGKSLEGCSFKVFEFLGFGGLKDDVDLVMYLLKNGVPLEQIIVRCDCGLIPYPGPLIPWHIERLEEAPKLAEKLKQMIPKNVDLIVVKTL